VTAVELFGDDGIGLFLILAAGLLVGMTILMIANMGVSYDKLPLFFSYVGVALLSGTVVAYYEITYQQMVLALFVLVGGWFILMMRRLFNWRDERRRNKWIKHQSKSKGVKIHA